MKNATNSKKSNIYPAALTVAGSDSGGGAGIEADLRTFNALGVFGCAAVTAVTAQNPREVRRIDAIPAEGVATQIAAVLDSINVRCVKSGMLFSREIIETLANAVKKYDIKLICDPVMVATSGAKLLADDAIDTMREKLLPVADWITPNIPEAELLLGAEISKLKDCDDAALDLAKKFGANVLLKSGHLNTQKEATDVVCRDGKLYHLISPMQKCPKFSTHGTGCTLSAAMTAGFALGFEWKQVLCEAKAFVYGSLVENVEIAPGIFAMYPPVEDCFKLVTLKGVTR